MRHKYLSENDYLLIDESLSKWTIGRLMAVSKPYAMSYIEKSLYELCKLIRTKDYAISNEYVGSLIEKPIHLEPNIPDLIIHAELKTAYQAFCNPDNFYTEIDCKNISKALSRGAEWAKTHCHKCNLPINLDYATPTNNQTETKINKTIDRSKNNSTILKKRKEESKKRKKNKQYTINSCEDLENVFRNLFTSTKDGGQLHRHNKRWNDIEDRLLCHYYENKRTVKQMSILMGRTTGSIISRLNHHYEFWSTSDTYIDEFGNHILTE